MNTEPLIKAVVAAILLLENSGSEEIDPDTAAQGLEAIGHELLQLSNEDRSYFVNAIDEICFTGRQSSGFSIHQINSV